MPKKYTSYYQAVKWGDCQLILCNNIPQIDPAVLEDSCLYNEETEEYEEVYQWFITSLTEWEKEWQEKTFSLHYIYSSVLDCYVLPVFHYGTPWESVPCEVLSEDWAKVNKDLLLKD